uniref:Uncharacterized protein n=1 Tax=Anguilla anguilla TaxID=7936 RepID=A0A0E9RJJ4_ANGAN
MSFSDYKWVLYSETTFLVFLRVTMMLSTAVHCAGNVSAK